MTFNAPACITAAAFAFALALSGTASAQTDAPKPATTKVVATVNGEAITELDLAAALPDVRDSLGQYPPDQQLTALINSVIDIRLMARAAEAAGLDKTEENSRFLAYVRERTLRNAYLQDKLGTVVTDAAVKARYDAEVAKFVPGDEVHAVHILVKTEEEAKAIIARLDQGGDFAAIAKEKSIDTGSGAQGGDLGFFGKGAMVKPFEDAAFALPAGTYTKSPVKSDFGWHVIKVLEKRKESPPTFEARKEELSRALTREFILAEIAKLHAAAKIEIVPAEPAPGAPAAAPTPAPAP